MSRKWLFVYTFLFVLICSFPGLGCSRSSRPSRNPHITTRPPQNVLLITVDTLRADHVNCYGYSPIHTPAIDSLAQGGVRFEWAFTPVPITLPSHASILTGLYPGTHGVLNNGEYRLGKSTKTMAQILKHYGFTTAAFVGAFVLGRQFGLDLGFEVYDDKLEPATKSDHETFSLYNERRGEKVTEAALAWLKERKPQRFFLWVHYFDPHTPYDPPGRFRSGYSGRPYDGEIAYTDSCLNLLLQGLKKEGILENTLIVLVADHGEGLGEHKESTHGIFIYDITVRVPLILWYPGLPEGMVSSHPAKTLDILPTVLEMLNIPPPRGLEGESLLSHLGRPEPDQGKEAAIFLETRFPEINFGWSRLQGIRNRRWKYIQAPRPELYDLEKDPQELYNVINRYPQQAQYLREILRSFTDTLPAVSESLYVPMDLTTRERLQNLGYVWADSSKPSSGHGRDPKDMIEVLNLFDEGSRLYTEGHYSEAISSFRRVIRKNPENILARFFLASAHKKVGRLEESIEEFQKVASLNPQFINVHNCLGNIYEEMAEYEKAALEYQIDMKLHPQVPLSYNNLGGVYLKQGRYQEAQEQFEKVLLLKPDRTTRIVTHSNLGIACEMMGLYDQAQQAYQSSLALDPDYLPARMGLGNIFLKDNQPERAIREWQKALNACPQNAEAHFNLGCTFLGMHRLTKAVDHLQEAIRLQPNLLQARVLLQRIQTQGQL